MGCEVLIADGDQSDLWRAERQLNIVLRKLLRNGLTHYVAGSNSACAVCSAAAASVEVTVDGVSKSELEGVGDQGMANGDFGNAGDLS